MRGSFLISLVLPFAGWFGVVQSVIAPTPAASPLDTTARVIGIAGVLGTLTVLVYRLGVWRQEMENTKHNVAAELQSFREEFTVAFNRVERRLERIERETRQARAERRASNM